MLSVKQWEDLVSKDRDERMWALAYKLADSGDYLSWWHIEVELRTQGYSRARQLLDDEAIRAELDRLCTNAQKERVDA